MSTPVPQPQLKPARYGLVAAVRDATADVERWDAGVAWSPECPGAAGTWPLCADENDASQTSKVLTDRADLQHFQSFTIWAGDRCSTLGGLTQDREGRATRMLINAQSTILERALQDGAPDLLDPGTPNPYLRDTNLTERHVEPLFHALGDLEDVIATTVNAAPAFILCTPKTALLWRQGYAIDKVGNLLYTPLGTLVVPGAGFTGADPTGVVDPTGDTAWAYATTNIQVYLGPIKVFGDERTIDRATNTWEVRAERAALVTFDPCLQVGIPVNLCETLCLSGS